MDSKDIFFEHIFNYYLNNSKDKIEVELVRQLSEIITDHYYEQYKRFLSQYPKSVKRYSSFQIKDLDHPQVFEIIITYLKNKFPQNYKGYAGVILSMTDAEIGLFEKNRQDFYNMW